MHQIRHYLTNEGKDVFLDWLKTLRDPLAKLQIVKRVNRIEQGNFGDYKFCRDGVWELRIDVGAGYRVYYAQSGLGAESQIVLLLCGGDKRKQDADIERAVKFWQDWKGRPQ
jgi:putative addiction module killer protein